jgi:predicted alpha/beta-fold hydrolase
MLCSRILERCTRIRGGFHPFLYAQGPLAQLFCAVMCPAPNVEYFPELLPMTDGGEVILDWSVPPDENLPNCPIVVILHGIGVLLSL